MQLFKGSAVWLFLLHWHWLPACTGEGFLIKNVRLGKCLHVSLHETEKIGLSDCKPHFPQFRWGWDAASRAIVSLKTRQCLTVHEPEEFGAIQLGPCGDRGRQSWACSKKGHLSLQGLGLHLSTQQEAHKAFLSRGKDKFSRWKTWMDEIICTADRAMAWRLPYLTEKPAVSRERIDQGETLHGETTTPSGTPTIPRESTTTPVTTTALTAEPDTNSTLLSKEEINLEAEDEKNTPRKHTENQKKTARAQLSGTKWKTAMLVLSPLAFILGLIILALNIHYNKKKKRVLSILKRCPEKSHQVSYEEQHTSFSRTRSTSHKTQIIPSSPPSPSLKHGEILIEWKDGTVSPLFDHMSYPIC